jgi:hypothetical protein
MKRLLWVLLILSVALLLSGCSMTRIAANQTALILLQGMAAYERETDITLAEKALPANLKMIEGLLEVSPNNSKLLLLICYGFNQYAFGFIEYQIDAADKSYDFETKNRVIAQAVDYYQRAMHYGLKLLDQSQNNFSKLYDKDPERLSEALQSFKKEHVPGLFWTAYAWISLINLQQQDPSKLAKLTHVDRIMKRVLELDETYYFGGVHLFYGAYYGGRPALLGGSPDKARIHLEQAIEISKGKYLLSKFLLAKYVAVPIQDRDLFESTLQSIIKAPPDLFPEQALANRIAQRYAKQWLQFADDLFL